MQTVYLSIALLLPDLSVARSFVSLRGLHSNDIGADDPFGDDDALWDDPRAFVRTALGAAEDDDAECWHNGCWSPSRPTLRDFDSASWALRSVGHALQMHTAAASLMFPDQWWEMRGGDDSTFRIRAVADLPNGLRVVYVTLRRDPPNPEGLFAEHIDRVWTVTEPNNGAEMVDADDTQHASFTDPHGPSWQFSPLPQPKDLVKPGDAKPARAESSSDKTEAEEDSNHQQSSQANHQQSSQVGHLPRRLRRGPEDPASRIRHQRVRHAEAEGLRRLVRRDEL